MLGAASLIGIVDGDDVFGIFAANVPTAIAWGVAALILLALGLAPRRRGDEFAVATGAEPATPVRRFD